VNTNGHQGRTEANQQQTPTISQNITLQVHFKQNKTPTTKPDGSINEVNITIMLSLLTQ
jgi:hypothetical protein